MKSKISFVVAIIAFAMALCLAGADTAMAFVTDLTVGGDQISPVTGDESRPNWSFNYLKSELILKDGFNDGPIEIKAGDDAKITIEGFCVATKIIFDANPNNTLSIEAVSSVTNPGFLTVRDKNGIKSSGRLQIKDPANVITRSVDVSSYLVVNTEGVVQIENPISEHAIQHGRGILFNGSTGRVNGACKFWAERSIGNGETLTTLPVSVLDLNGNKITVKNGGMLDNETNTGIIKGPGRIVVHSGGVLKKGVVDESAGSVNVESSGGSSPPPPSSEFSGGCSAGFFGIAGLFVALAAAGRRRFFS